MRIAVLDKDRCKPKGCNYLCMRICPINKIGKECIIVSEETKKPIISESLCTGCGICIKKCPYDAIYIINLPEEIGNPIHQYGINGFRLYNLPIPKEGVVGVIGSNGIGKTTALKILSGELIPNLGESATWDEIIKKFKGNEIQSYFKKLSNNEIKAVYKPQYVDAIPKHVKGSVREILKKSDETGSFENLVVNLNLENSLHKDISELSGGELQRVAIAACLMKDADVYLLDEPSSYLDVKERLNMAHIIREIKNKYIFVVEHDLIVLDYLSDYIHVIFGTPGAYGIISNIMSTRSGINEYLDGFLRSENMRFREEIKFDIIPPKERLKSKKIVEYPELIKDYDGFSLDVESGTLYESDVIGILGPNATGKTTFVKILANVVEADNIKLDLNLKISYKPQYITPNDNLVLPLKLKQELVDKFSIKHLIDKKMSELSGGELQKVAIADCLSREADSYLLDEPSAYLDIEERLKLAKYIKRFAAENKKSVMVVDHDILLVDYVSNELMVFEGESGKNGFASKPLDLRSGMNKFLRYRNVTFRRDPDTGRPRVNKPDSVKDREQKSSGEYYYVG